MDMKTARDSIERYYRAMEAGSEPEMERIFASDAVYVEPFSKGGTPTTHSGRQEIVGWLGESFRGANHGVTITLDRLDIDGDVAIAEWTCVGPMLPGPMKGHDRYEIRDGAISRLDTRFGPAS